MGEKTVVSVKMVLVQRVIPFVFEDDSNSISCACSVTDTVLGVVMSKHRGDSSELGNYLTSRGFSSLRAAQIAARHFLWNRYNKMQGVFDVGVAIFDFQGELLCAYVPHSNRFSLKNTKSNLQDFHRSYEEFHKNSVHKNSIHKNSVPFIQANTKG